MKKRAVTIVECLKCGSKVDSTGLQVNSCKCRFVGVDNNGRIIGEPEDYKIIQADGVDEFADLRKLKNEFDSKEWTWID